ncbi:tRNA dimethylallyltransferase 2 isoform X1 [Syzygium oleosum]|uniref:tRNA dimethylallyltransferase 2 isoform X1 n=1 Tax=Syzygium oleosum TaxID=219896 RepID=UPI0011D19014|nr:tRNA dimethylallyltransferase 2 isoform X1 [Syzygium oleosum]
MDGDGDGAAEPEERSSSPGGGGPGAGGRKPKVVIIMGPTGSGKSRLAIDLAAHLPVEVVSADSMQVYRGLDVLTNKVPLDEQQGVPHHLLGTVSPNVEFTAKAFRDSAVPLIDEILSRNNLPVIVGGTNYYIQALVSLFLLDDSLDHMDDGHLDETPGDEHDDCEVDFNRDRNALTFDRLKDIDPVAAQRIHPNNQRKINQYLNLYAQSGLLPSELFQGTTLENWGRIENSKYDCCFICVDACLPVLDRYVEDRVNCMVEAGLLNEVYDIYCPNSDCTRGLRQAIGVREFEDFLRVYIADVGDSETSCSHDEYRLKENTGLTLASLPTNQLKVLLQEAIDKFKLNTRRLVRRQKRRIRRLQTLFGWNIHYVDATEAISSQSEDSWIKQVVQPSLQCVRSFYEDRVTIMPNVEAPKSSATEFLQRNLWTQYICKACGDRVLRGAHEWEQHKQGRAHRKRTARLRKSLNRGLVTAVEQER